MMFDEFIRQIEELEQQDHEEYCPLYHFYYEVGSGQDIPRCTCEHTKEIRDALTELDVLENVIETHVGGDGWGNVFDKIRAPLKWQRRQVMQWQPIETAPKDGRLILVRAQHDGVHYFTAYCGKDNMFYQPRQTYDGLPDMYIIEPTHWMPLPEPPKSHKPEVPE